MEDVNDSPVDAAGPVSVTPTNENTCAVLVTYFPDSDILSRLRRTQRQWPSMIVVDNATRSDVLNTLRDFSSSPTVRLVENDENQGLGHALNQAVSLAMDAGFSWVVTFDQDTVVDEHMFDELVAVYESTQGRSPIVGSNYWNSTQNRPFLTCASNASGAGMERRTVITSGMLLSLDLYRNIGGFREDYFIDSIDHEYCLRARRHGYSVTMSCRQLMSHAIGDADSPAGFRLLAFDHPPLRKYYMTRNTLVTTARFCTREPVWAMRQMARLAVELMSIVLLEKNKRAKLRAYAMGAMDAFRNRLGRRDRL